MTLPLLEGAGDGGPGHEAVPIPLARPTHRVSTSGFQCVSILNDYSTRKIDDC